MAIKPFILFITGISTAGKTTIYEALKADANLSHVEFHDIDEDGVPSVGRTPWRGFRVEELLYDAVTKLDEGKSTVVCGITKPHEVIESRHLKHADRIHFLLVDIPIDTFTQRLRPRIEQTKASGKYDEVFGEDAQEELLVATKNLKRVLLNSTLAQKTGHVLDASALDKKQMIDTAKELIQKLEA